MSETPHAGQLRHRVTIQVPATATRDSFGTAQDDWRSIATVWARVEASGGSEPAIASLVSPDTTYRVTLRWWNGLTAQHRLLWEGRLLNIESVAPDVKRRFMVLTCREG